MVERIVCSFCGKGLTRVKKLIAGPGTYVCEECIDVCNEILEEELPSRRWRSTSEPEYGSVVESSKRDLEQSRRDEQVVRFTREVAHDDLADLWGAFKDRQDDNARRALFERYWSLAESLANDA